MNSKLERKLSTERLQKWENGNSAKGYREKMGKRGASGSLAREWEVDLSCKCER